MADADGSGVRQRVKPPASQRPKQSEINQKYPPPKQSSAPFELPSIFAFYILLASHTIGALYHPIQDCDEVFNYWEPTHYLRHGHGFQTWEYSPEYAIRSWAYAGAHAFITLVTKIIPFGSRSKIAEFYILRIALGIFCAVCETRLFSKISAALNPRIAITWVFIMATAPGMFHASISYLPSSFAMYAVTLGLAAFLDWRGGLRTAQGMMCIGGGSFLSWPFAAAMAIPFMLEEALFAAISDRQGIIELFWRLVDGAVRALIPVFIQMAFDAFFYKKFVIVPLNIVWYNIFSGKGGPELYGVESWDFYVRNLFLNFHVWLVLALIAMPLILAQHFMGTKGATKASYLRGIFFVMPFYLWLGIFTLQPHKEERFMYPAYPALALNAAMALHILLANYGSTDPKDMISKIPVQLRLFTILAFVILAIDISVFRILGTVTAYNAPLSIYQPLHNDGFRPDDFVCLSKEWYRFPSHYLLPEGMHAKFVKSEFSGLLPGEFNEAPSRQGFGMFPGTWLEPMGMNDENREDPNKYIDVKHCTFLVDSHLPSTQTTALEPSYIDDSEHWDKVKCLPFLDAGSTGIVGRMGWVPDLPIVPQKWKRVYGEYCLLKKKKAMNS